MNSHDSLLNYYTTNFNLMYNFGDKLDVLNWDEKLMPWEKTIYLDLLLNKIKEQEAAMPKEEPLWDPQGILKKNV